MWPHSNHSTPPRATMGIVLMRSDVPEAGSKGQQLPFSPSEQSPLLHEGGVDMAIVDILDTLR